MIKINIYFIGFGCKVNLYETEVMKNLFFAAGYTPAEDKYSADICLINSCTVTALSDKKLRQEIHVLRKNNPNTIIILTGCFPQAFKAESMEISEADIITGTKDRKEIVNLVQKYIKNRERIIDVSDYTNNEEFEIVEVSEFSNRTRAFVKIQDGCNQFCNYCIIPKARGRLRSKSIKSIKQEVSNLAKAGHKEIVLVGINLAFYGVGLNLRLVDAVEACSEIKGIERIRLGSLEPEIISDADILRLSKVKKLCPQFHLSLQSGCDRTLKAMNRKYTTSQYFDLVKKLRNAFDDCAITTDIMVGFPSETNSDFIESLAFVEKMEFSKAHIFRYSKRKGTVAEQMPNQIKSEVKDYRASKMSEICNYSQNKFLKNQVGKIFPVLFEKENCTDFHQGYAPNYTLIKIPAKKADKSLRREVFYVKISEVRNDFCIGEIQKN